MVRQASCQAAQQASATSGGLASKHARMGCAPSAGNRQPPALPQAIGGTPLTTPAPSPSCSPCGHSQTAQSPAHPPPLLSCTHQPAACPHVPAQRGGRTTRRAQSGARPGRGLREGAHGGAALAAMRHGHLLKRCVVGRSQLHARAGRNKRQLPEQAALGAHRSRARRPACRPVRRQRARRQRPPGPAPAPVPPGPPPAGSPRRWRSPCLPAGRRCRRHSGQTWRRPEARSPV